MKAGLYTIFWLSLQTAVFAQDAPLPPCEAITRLDAQTTQILYDLANMLLRYTEKHPAVIAARKELADLAAARAAQEALAKSQRIVCPSKSEIAAPPRR